MFPIKFCLSFNKITIIIIIKNSQNAVKLEMLKEKNGLNQVTKVLDQTYMMGIIIVVAVSKKS